MKKHHGCTNNSNASEVNPHPKSTRQLTKGNFLRILLEQSYKWNVVNPGLNRFVASAATLAKTCRTVFSGVLCSSGYFPEVGHDLIDFVDVCAVANVSVFILDEPFHGYYIHGKAPSSKGDWCHTELAKAIHDESKGPSPLLASGLEKQTWNSVSATNEPRQPKATPHK
eukprot:2843756-Amphidinium_carterae.1